MLPRVALFDSLDSSFGSKPRASRDLDMREMDTIDESLDRNGLLPLSPCAVFVSVCSFESCDFVSSDEDGVDEPDAIMFTPSVDQRQQDDTEVTETHGVTIKTHTGEKNCIF